MFWLYINGGWVGPFVSRKDARARYEQIAHECRVLKAQMWYGGMETATKLLYPII